MKTKITLAILAGSYAWGVFTWVGLVALAASGVHGWLAPLLVVTAVWSFSWVRHVRDEVIRGER